MEEITLEIDGRGYEVIRFLGDGLIAINESDHKIKFIKYGELDKIKLKEYYKKDILKDLSEEGFNISPETIDKLEDMLKEVVNEISYKLRE